MPLSGHFREFRGRVLRSLLVFGIVFIAGLFAFQLLYDAVYGPFTDAVAVLPEGSVLASTSSIGGGLMMRLKLSGFASLLISAPYWLYQIWAFVLPGLHASEKK